MDIFNLFLIFSSQFIVFSIQSTVTVSKGDTAILEWDVSKYLLNLQYQIYSDNIKIITGSSRAVLLDPATEKYGSRITAEKKGSKIRLTLKEVMHSDEAKFTMTVEVGISGKDTLDEITLDVTGLSSSDTGMIVGIVIGIIVLITIIVVFVCYRKKKQSNRRGDESQVPMKSNRGNNSSQSEQVTTDTENHYAQYQPEKANDAPPKAEPIVYSELGPSGGREGPKGLIPKSNYAEAK